MKAARIAIYPGTFDPITFGHIDIIKRSARLFDSIIIGVAADIKKTALFSLKERVEMVESEIKKLKLKNIQVKPFSGLLVDFLKMQKARIIVRGIRAFSDFEYEFQMFYLNHKLNPDVETIFLSPTQNGHFISSSFVREVARLNGDLEGIISEEVYSKLRKKFKVR